MLRKPRLAFLTWAEVKDEVTRATLFILPFVQRQILSQFERWIGGVRKIQN